jgi:hypothetical protein
MFIAGPTTDPIAIIDHAIDGSEIADIFLVSESDVITQIRVDVAIGTVSRTPIRVGEP